jgi:signal peptidase I
MTADTPGISVTVDWKDWLVGKRAGYIAIALLAVACGYAFGVRGVRFFMVPSSSMEPTLLPNDMLVTVREPAYHRGDIVVLRHDGEYLVKRITGLPGDAVGVLDGGLLINGKYASEPYLREPMRYNITEPIRVPAGRFVFMGDNRNISDDSSVNHGAPGGPGQYDLGWMKDIVGRVVFLYYPYSRWGAVPSYPLANIAGE